MKIAVPAESREFETRVAASPETVRKFAGMGAQVLVETGAGAAARITDAAYREAGAEITGDYASTVAGADLVLKVQRPTAEETGALASGTTLVCLLNPFGDRDIVDALAAQGVQAFAMEFLPRITRAQSMDVLSSQANLAGYKAVLEAATLFDRAFPQMMTAAGTIPPAKVFVMGAGVAGLQAIATAKRLGAVVSATDVRAAAKEQVESLAAKFVMVESEETDGAETTGGYAREMSEDYRKRQAELVAQHIAKQDIVITTALIPGRPAPVLVTEAMVHSMSPGAVIVDLAVEQGGNCPLTRLNEVVDVNGVRIVGFANTPGRIAADASSLYARNLFNFLGLMIDKDSGGLNPDWDDEILKATVVTRDGSVVHPSLNDGQSR